MVARHLYIGSVLLAASIFAGNASLLHGAEVLLRFEVFEPEFVVGVLEVIALISTVAVHSVRIDHKVELLAFLVESIKKL